MTTIVPFGRFADKPPVITEEFLNLVREQLVSDPSRSPAAIAFFLQQPIAAIRAALSVLAASGRLQDPAAGGKAQAI